MNVKDLKNVSDRDARKTALIVAVVVILAASFFWFRGRMTTALAAIVIATILVVIGFIPPLARLFHQGWMRFAFALGYVNSRILLTVIYVFVFVPYGIVSRLFGRDPLYLRGERRESYWHKRAVPRQTREQFERLF